MVTTEIRYKLGMLEIKEPAYNDDYELVELSFDQDSNLKAIYFCGANASSTTNLNDIKIGATSCLH
ncbi:hypothetical protein OAT61_02115 [Gammaproteobacteria bacterium]|jgi:hypothetical protein|nr:hypothetical protein [Gammaproteobacteria bacterium]